MCAEKEDFAALDYCETVAQVDCAEAHGLDLGADEHYARLQSLLDEIIVIGFFVGRDNLHNPFSGKAPYLV